MNVLFAADEATPLYKIGGLGDVAGSLPKNLAALGIDVRICLPKHPELHFETGQWAVFSRFTMVYNRQELPVTVWGGFLPESNVPTYVFEEARYLSEHTDASDNHADKFAVFSLAVATWLTQPETLWQPHIIHLNDWHTALIPVIIKHLYHRMQYRYLITIHNLAYQGNTNTPVAVRLNLPQDACRVLSWDGSDNHTNILMEGLIHSDCITTVSPSYALEILTEEYGEKLQSILEAKKAQLVGVVNGIDTDFFNPQVDPFIPHRFTAATVEEAKAANKAALQEKLGLPIETNTLIGFVGRVDGHQKGIDLVIDALRERVLTDSHTQFVFLGTGEPELEKQLHQYGDSQASVRIITRYDEPLAHHIYAAADLMIIPSRFEPCGLVQLIAMRYGALPVARATGGLKDTIIHDRTGFLFTDYKVEALTAAIAHAKQQLAKPEVKRVLEQEALCQDFSWMQSAKKYVNLYQNLLLEKFSAQIDNQ